MPDKPDDPEVPEEPTEEDGPGHIIIIDLIPDTTTVTGATTVTWSVTVPDNSQSTVSLSFYEVLPTSTPNMFSFEPLTVSPMPTVSWANGVGTFSVDMDSDIFDQLQANPTNFTVKAEIPNVQSSGLSKVDIDLTSP